MNRYIVQGITEVYQGVYEAEIVPFKSGKPISNRLLRLLKRQAHTRQEKEELAQMLNSINNGHHG